MFGYFLVLSFLLQIAGVRGFGMNLIKVPEDDRSQIFCTIALLRKYFHSGETLSGSVISMSITSASSRVQQNLLKAIHSDTEAWTVVVKNAREDAVSTSPMQILHEKPQCYFLILENLEDEDLDDIFEDWKTNVNWNPLAQFVVYLASVEETDDEMTELMIEILLSFMNKKIYNVNVIGQNEENGFYYGKTVFPYHPDNNCGNRVITIETLDICDYQETDKEDDDEEEEYDSYEDKNYLDDTQVELSAEDSSDNEDGNTENDNEVGEEDNENEENDAIEPEEDEEENEGDVNKDENVSNENEEGEEDDPIDAEEEKEGDVNELDDAGGTEDNTEEEEELGKSQEHETDTETPGETDEKEEGATEMNVEDEPEMTEDEVTSGYDNGLEEEDKILDEENDENEDDISMEGAEKELEGAENNESIDKESVENENGVEEESDVNNVEEAEEKSEKEENVKKEENEEKVKVLNEANEEQYYEKEETKKNFSVDRKRVEVSEEGDEEEKELEIEEVNEIEEEENIESDDRVEEGEEGNLGEEIENEAEGELDYELEEASKEELRYEKMRETKYKIIGKVKKEENIHNDKLEQKLDRTKDRQDAIKTKINKKPQKSLPKDGNKNSLDKAIKRKHKRQIEENTDSIEEENEGNFPQSLEENEASEEEKRFRSEELSSLTTEKPKSSTSTFENDSTYENDDSSDTPESSENKSNSSGDSSAKFYLEELYPALFLDKFPKDLSGCPLVAAYRPWEPYIFNEVAEEVDYGEESSEPTETADSGTEGDGEDYEGSRDEYDGEDYETNENTPEVKLSGIEYKMVETIGERLHISIDLQVENTNLYHLFQLLIDGDIEMVVGGIDEDPSISQFVSSTIPYHQDDLTWCVAKAKRKHNLFNFLASFQLGVWLLTLVFIVVTAFSVMIIKRLLRVHLWSFQGYFTIVLRILGITLSQSTRLFGSIPDALKLTLYAAFFMALMFNNVYQSFLVSTLTNPKSSAQISHIEEIYRHRMTIMGSVENVRHLNKDGEIFKYIREKFQMCYNIEDCLSRAAHDEHLAVAVSRQHSFYNPRIPRDRLYCFDRDENMYVYLVTMLLPKKFHLLHKINPVIQHIIESGHMQKWARDLDMKRKIHEEIHRAREDQFQSLNLAQVVGTFVFSGFLILQALLLFVLEKWAYWMVLKRRTRLKLVKLLHKQFKQC